jgi:peroxiredoxin
MAAYQAALGRFAAHHTHVLGISVDSVPCKQAWADRLGGLGFDLLSDFYPHGAVAERYGVLRPDGIAERAVFLVDRRGRIAFARTYDIPHEPSVDEVFAVLEQLADG